MKKKLLALLMTLTLVSGLVMAFGAEETFAASGSYKLPTKVTTYEYKKGKWKKTGSYTYKYDSKGNMTYWDGAKLKPVYSNGKLKKVTVTGKSDQGEKYKTTKTYDAKGRISYWECPRFDWVMEYSYNSKGYVKKMHPNTNASNYSYKYYGNGLPKQITMNKRDDFEDFKIKYVEKYNKQGIEVSGKSYEKGKLKSSWKKKITKKNGNITQIVSTNNKGGKYKTVYTYGKAKTKSKKTYAAIMGMTQGSLMFEAIGDNSAVGWCY